MSKRNATRNYRSVFVHRQTFPVTRNCYSVQFSLLNVMFPHENCQIKPSFSGECGEKVIPKILSNFFSRESDETRGQFLLILLLLWSSEQTKALGKFFCFSFLTYSAFSLFFLPVPFCRRPRYFHFNNGPRSRWCIVLRFEVFWSERFCIQILLFSAFDSLNFWRFIFCVSLLDDFKGLFTNLASTYWWIVIVKFLSPMACVPMSKHRESRTWNLTWATFISPCIIYREFGGEWALEQLRDEFI